MVHLEGENPRFFLRCGIIILKQIYTHVNFSELLQNIDLYLYIRLYCMRMNMDIDTV